MISTAFSKILIKIMPVLWHTHASIRMVLHLTFSKCIILSIEKRPRFVSTFNR